MITICIVIKLHKVFRYFYEKDLLNHLYIWLQVGWISVFIKFIYINKKKWNK